MPGLTCTKVILSLFQAVYRNQLGGGVAGAGGLTAQHLQLQLQQQQQYIQQLAAAGQIGGFPGAPYVINPGTQEPYLTLNLTGEIDTISEHYEY